MDCDFPWLRAHSTVYHVERVPDSGVSSGDIQIEKAPHSMPNWASRELPHMMECQVSLFETVEDRCRCVGFSFQYMLQISKLSLPFFMGQQ